jgi:hypothetical protein
MAELPWIYSSGELGCFAFGGKERQPEKSAAGFDGKEASIRDLIRVSTLEGLRH